MNFEHDVIKYKVHCLNLFNDERLRCHRLFHLFALPRPSQKVHVSFPSPSLLFLKIAVNSTLPIG